MMGAAPRWTILLVAFWSVLLIGLGLLCVLAPQIILAEEGYRTVMRGVASGFGMLVIALGLQALLAIRSGRIAALQSILFVVAVWSLLLPTAMMTNLGSVEPLRMATDFNVFVLAAIAQFLLGLPALLGAIRLGRVVREASL